LNYRKEESIVKFDPLAIDCFGGLGRGLVPLFVLG
jgi:hypothetical protein